MFFYLFTMKGAHNEFEILWLEVKIWLACTNIKSQLNLFTFPCLSCKHQLLSTSIQVLPGSKTYLNLLCLVFYTLSLSKELLFLKHTLHFLFPCLCKYYASSLKSFLFHPSTPLSRIKEAYSFFRSQT